MSDAASLEKWVRAWLSRSLAPLEGVIVAVACRAGAEDDSAAVAAANAVLTATIAPPSIRAASHEMGEQLLALASTWSWSRDAVARLSASARGGDVYRGWNHAAVFGVLGAIAGGTAVETLRAYFHQSALGLIGAGVRAVPVGHTHGQQILAYLHDEIVGLASALADHPLELAGSGSPFYEVLCDEQTRLYSRLFRS